jgi:predicted transcriptional regulator
MTRWTPVRDVMTKKLITIKTTDQPIVAMQVMTKHDIGSVVVTKDGKPVGILTDRDIMKRICPEERCRKATAEEMMSHPLITIDTAAKLDEAVELMTDEGIRRLLVEENGDIVGIVTQKDLMRGRRACARLCWVL